MKDKINIEKLRALRSFLGFADKIESKEASSFLKELNNMKDRAPIPKQIRENAWIHIQKEIEKESENLTDKKSQNTKAVSSSLFDLFSNWRFAFSAIILFIAVFAGIKYSAFFTDPKKNSTAKESIYLKGGIISSNGKIINQASSLKTINIHNNAFSWINKKPVTAHIGSNINLWIREIAGLKAIKMGNELKLFLQSGKLLIDDSSLTKEAEKKIRLIIVTPQFEYQIIGTKFILETNSKEEFILLKEGKVQAKLIGQLDNFPSRIIKSGQFWKADLGFNTKKSNKLLPAQNVNPAQINKIFNKFKKSSPEFTSLKALISPVILPKKKIPVLNRIILKSQEVIRGKIIFKNKEKIIIKSTLGQVLEIERRDIEQIH